MADVRKMVEEKKVRFPQLSKKQEEYSFLSDVFKRIANEDVVQRHFTEDEIKHAENALSKLYAKNKKYAKKEEELLEKEKKALVGICNLFLESKIKIYYTFANKVLSHPKLQEMVSLSNLLKEFVNKSKV